MEGGVQVPRPSTARASGTGSGRLGTGLARWRPKFFRRRALRRDMSGTSRFSLRSSHSSHALFPDEVYESTHNGNGTTSCRPTQMRKTLSGLSSGFLLLDRSNSSKHLHHHHRGAEENATTTSISPTTSSTVTVTDTPSPCDTATDNAGLLGGDIDSQHRRSFRRTKGTLNLHDYKPDNMRNNHHRNRGHANLGSFHRNASTANTDTGDDDTSTLAPRPYFRKVLSGVLGRLR